MALSRGATVLISTPLAVMTAPGFTLSGLAVRLKGSLSRSARGEPVGVPSLSLFPGLLVVLLRPAGRAEAGCEVGAWPVAPGSPGGVERRAMELGLSSAGGVAWSV